MMPIPGFDTKQRAYALCPIRRGRMPNEHGLSKLILFSTVAFRSAERRLACFYPGLYRGRTGFTLMRLIVIVQ